VQERRRRLGGWFWLRIRRLCGEASQKLRIQ
jgi:hypothetical protein